MKVLPIRIKNETPTIDKELPKLQKVTIDEVKENLVERNRRFYTYTSKSVRYRIGCKRSARYIKRKENKELSFLLDYNKHDMDWQKYLK